VNTTGTVISTKDWNEVYHNPNADCPQSWIVQIRGAAIETAPERVELGLAHYDCTIEIRRSGAVRKARECLVDLK